MARRILVLLTLILTFMGAGALAGDSDLPEQLPLPHSNKEIQKLVDLANQEYSDRAPDKKLIHLLTKIRDGKDPKSRFDDLKKMRSAGLMMRAVWEFLSVDGQQPKKFDELVKYLGQLQDRINDKQFDQLHSKAKEALQSVEEGNGDLGVLPEKKIVSIKQFTANLKSMAHEIKIAAHTQGKLDFKSYHEMRKGVRAFKSLFELEEDLNGDESAARTAKFLSSLSGSIGATKDDLEKKYRNGETGVATKVSDEDRRHIDEFLERLGG